MVSVKIERIKAPINRTLMHYLSQVEPNIEKALTGPIKDTILNEMEKTVAGWSRKATFKARLIRTTGDLILEATPDGPNAFKWRIIGGGLGPRQIVSKGKLMTFPINYKASTYPGGRWGRRRQKYGEIVTGRREVGPHKIEARKFSKVIIERKSREIVNEIRESMKRAVGDL